MSTFTMIESLALQSAMTDRRNALAHARAALRVAVILRRPDLAWRCNELIATIGSV